MELKRIGSCSRCGDCCRFQCLFGSLTLSERERLREIFGYLPEGQLRQCPHLELAKGHKTRCRIYERRPSHCKAFPAEPQDIEGLSKCGYKFEEKERPAKPQQHSPQC